MSAKCGRYNTISSKLLGKGDRHVRKPDSCHRSEGFTRQVGYSAACYFSGCTLGWRQHCCVASFTTQIGDALYTISGPGGFYQYSTRIPLELLPTYEGSFTFLGIIAGICSIFVLIISGAVRQGLCQFNINLIKKDAPAEFGVLFSKISNLGKCFLLNLAMGFLIFAWTLLLIIPGIIAAYRYAMAPYIMAQNPDVGVMDAIDQSKELMRGHKSRLFWLDLTFIGWAFLSALTFGIGFLWLNPYMEAARAIFYLERTGQLPST